MTFGSSRIGTMNLMEDIFRAGKYIYFKKLSACVANPPSQLPPPLRTVRTPLIISAWCQHLRDHPDPEFVEYILSGIANGFRIGYSYSEFKCTSAKRNMLSATENKGVVEKYLAKECKAGTVIGPVDKTSVHLHINRFGVIPKPNRPGEWRLIVDLSHPEDASVSDGILPSLCSIDDALALIIDKGRGTQLAKLDLESAYRMVPVHPELRVAHEGSTLKQQLSSHRVYSCATLSCTLCQ